ncbi:MAG: ABC transporter substrate-binding protein [Pseudomonadota bacterium]
MNAFHLLRRIVTTTLIAAAATTSASAQTNKIKFTLDWRFEAPAAPFLLALGKGYFTQEKLDVTIDSGSGSGISATRVAAGTYDMGFADLVAVMEFVGNNPTSPQRPVGVMMVYNNTPSAIFALKKSGIKQPSDLIGKKLGAPTFDAARRAFPVFAKANNIDNAKINWIAMDPTLRETMLVRGDVDAISGFTFYSPASLFARGIKQDELLILPYSDFGVKLYGNSIIANSEFAKNNPETVKAFLRAVAKGYRDTINNPAEAARYLKQREPLVDEKLELEKLKQLVTQTLISPDARKEGFGQVSPPRIALMATQVSDAFGTKTRIDPSAIFDSKYLPSKAELNILGK